MRTPESLRSPIVRIPQSLGLNAGTPNTRAYAEVSEVFGGSSGLCNMVNIGDDWVNYVAV